MGREVWFEVRRADTKEVLWDGAANQLYFCGRNEETNSLSGLLNEDALIPLSTAEQRKVVINRLRDIEDKNEHQHSLTLELIDELILARRNVATVDEFYKFTDEIDRLRSADEDSYWERATQMIAALEQTVREAIRLANFSCYDTRDPDFASANIEIVLVWSE